MTAGLGATQKPPVISLKDFTTVKEWVLDITWHAKDSFEDSDFSAKLDITASARFYLKRLDHQDAWGRWETQKQQTSSLVYKASMLDKRNGQSLAYQGLQTPPLMAVANFQVGGETPGYQLACQVMFPAQVKGPPLGSMDSPLMLTTTDMGPKPVFCSGPLPESGTTISGSAVIQAAVPPFGTSRAPQTRVGIQYVLKPLIELAPLKPIKPQTHKKNKPR
jgi:hypothetical protein